MPGCEASKIAQAVDMEPLPRIVIRCMSAIEAGEGGLGAGSIEPKGYIISLKTQTHLYRGQRESIRLGCNTPSLCVDR